MQIGRSRLPPQFRCIVAAVSALVIAVILALPKSDAQNTGVDVGNRNDHRCLERSDRAQRRRTLLFTSSAARVIVAADGRLRHRNRNVARIAVTLMSLFWALLISQHVLVLPAALCLISSSDAAFAGCGEREPS